MDIGDTRESIIVWKRSNVMAQISVIISLYNVEDYMKKCVASVQKQTFSDLEIILVDDGSEDSTGAICDEFARRDSRISVIHKPNGGISTARNTGLKAAESEYVLFIDGDDYIAPDMIERLYGLLNKYEADMSVCGAYNVYGRSRKPQCSEREEFVCGSGQAFAYSLTGKKMVGSVCTRLMKRKLIEDLQFPVGKVYEDIFFTILLMQRVRKVAVTTEPMYYYVHREGSITTMPYQKRDMDVVEACQEALDCIREKFPMYRKEAEFRLTWAYFTVLDRMLLTENYRELEEFGQTVLFLRRHTGSVLKSREFRTARKIGAAALFLNVRLYRLLVLCQNKKYSLRTSG